MPLQHISDNMLKAMRRGTTRKKTYELIEQIRREVPGIALRTTLIAGYPGESEEDFQALLAFVEDAKFNRLGVFQYSHEENTYAYNFDDDVSPETKAERVSAIMEAQQEISFAHNQELVGRTLKVLVDRKEGKYFIGRTEYDSPEVDNEVLIKGKGAQVGEFCMVKIDDATEFDLYGTVLGA
jgi:ribosomal protein S12 methylthiotransferase